MKKIAEKEQMSAVMMHQFGINTVVLTQHKNLDEVRNKLTRTPDHLWGQDEKGKAYLHQQLQVHLLAEDSYFEANLHAAVPSNKRWVNFMDDCVNFAVLDSVVRNEPLLLMHPNAWSKQVKRTKNAYKARRRPCLIADVPVYSKSKQ